MMKQQTYTYNPSRPLMESTELLAVGRYLATLGFLKSAHIGKAYDYNYSVAVKAYQKSKGLNADGQLTENLIKQLEADCSAKLAHTTPPNSQTNRSTDVNLFIEDSFFSEQRESVLRNGGYSIVMVIGDDHQYTKTITGVRMRSKTIQVDGSGNPIMETYEFIAKDLKENTEPTD